MAALAGDNQTPNPKPRGRPPGSKNKPKPPIIITRQTQTSMQTLILDLAAGADILRSISAFARRRRIGISILAGVGAVSSVALRRPEKDSGSFSLSGCFDIVSLCGSFTPESSPEFRVCVGVGRGEVVGGVVVGPLVAAGRVVVVGGSFVAAEVERLPAVEGGEEAEVVAPARVPASGGVSGGCGVVGEFRRV